MLAMVSSVLKIVIKMTGLIYNCNVLIHPVKWHVFSWNDAFILHYAFLQDVCPYVFNPEEDSLVCEPIGIVISLVM